MATYLPGVTDYIPQIQRFQPDLNFYNNALQVKQGQFEKGYEQISSIYGSVLNSPMLRDIDNKRRDEFFRQADSNIKKIAGMDLSRQENVNLAANIFKPFYEDKNLMKDISWTRQYQKELSRADSFKNCLDPKKCNGQYWDTGVQALNYRAQEFMESDDQQALGFSNPEFVPYHNVMDKALSIAKEANLNVKKDVNTGNWIVTYKNGQLVEEPLRNLFIQQIGSNPDIQKMYTTQAYVNRKNWVNQNEFSYGGRDGAEMAYLTNMISAAKVGTQKEIIEQKNYVTNLQDQKNYLENKFSTQGLSDDEVDAYKLIREKMLQAPEAEKQVQDKSSILSNIGSVNLSVMREYVDQLVGDGLMLNELSSAASILSHQGEEVNMKENPFALQAARFAHEKEMLQLGTQADIVKMTAKSQLDMELAKYKQDLKIGAATGNGAYLQSSFTAKPNEPGTDIGISEAEKTEDFAVTESMKAKSEVASANQVRVMDFLSNVYDQASLSDSDAGRKFKNEMDKRFGGTFTKEALEKKLAEGGLTWYEVFNMYNDAKNRVNASKNTDWGSSVLKENSRRMLEIDQWRDIEHKMNTQIVSWSKQAVKEVQDANTSVYSKDADLLLGNNGLPADEATFINKFKQRHKQDPYYKSFSDVEAVRLNFARNWAKKKGVPLSEVMEDLKHLVSDEHKYAYPRGLSAMVEKYGDDFIKTGMGLQQLSDAKFSQQQDDWDYTKHDSQEILDRAAKAAYADVKQTYYQNYSKKPVSLFGNSNIGRLYGGVKSHTVGTSRPLDPRYKGEDFKHFASVAQDLTQNQNNLSIQVAFGTGAKSEDLEKIDSERGKKAFNLFRQLYDAQFKTYGKTADKVPVFQFDYHNIANNKEGLSAVTIRDIDNEYLKSLKGSKSQPSEYKEIISEIEKNGGMTIYFDKSKANNLFTQATKPSMLDYKFRLGESYKIPGVADLTVKLDNNQYKVSGKIFPVGHVPVLTTDEIVFPLEMKPEQVNQFMIDMVDNIKKSNDATKVDAAYQQLTQMMQNNPNWTQKDKDGFIVSLLTMNQ
jgi:hypothetical protein